MEDVEIINLLWQREEMGLLELERKYRAYCNAIAMNILQSAEDAEECVSDTWMKIWNSIPPNRPESLKLYAARIMRNLAFNRYRDARAERRGGGQPCAPLKELSECISEQSVDELSRPSLRVYIHKNETSLYGATIMRMTFRRLRAGMD